MVSFIAPWLQQSNQIGPSTPGILLDCPITKVVVDSDHLDGWTVFTRVSVKVGAILPNARVWIRRSTSQKIQYDRMSHLFIHAGEQSTTRRGLMLFEVSRTCSVY